MNEQYPDKSRRLKKRSFSNRSKKYPGFLHWEKQPEIDFTGRSAIRFCDQKLIAIDPDLFLIAIVIAITVLKPGSDSKTLLWRNPVFSRIGIPKTRRDVIVRGRFFLHQKTPVKILVQQSLMRARLYLNSPATAFLRS
jgi:hypothetical protein